MLRIHFTEADFAHTRVVAPDPMWETVLSLHRLRAPDRDSPVFATWRDRARRRIADRPVRRQLGLLCSLVPLRGYFPDFLTPPDVAPTLADGLDALRRTPRARLFRDLAHEARERVLPGWTRSLANGDRDTLDQLATAIRDVHDVLIAPAWPDLAADVRADSDHREHVLGEGGPEGLFDSFDWLASWDGHVLSAEYPYELDIHLNGRGLRLIPSYFCWHRPVALADTALPPVLVYPVRRCTTWRLRAHHEKALEDLLGRTRARVLAATAHGPLSTTEVARRAGVATSSASEHLSLLRAASLVSSRREANTVLHKSTTVGDALLAGEPG